MVIYNARTHRVTTIDGRETCPCTTNLFIDPATGKPMNYTPASDQPLSHRRAGERRNVGDRRARFRSAVAQSIRREVRS